MTDLGLDLDELGLSAGLASVGRGRQPASVTAEFARELTQADLAMPPVKTGAPPIKKLRDTHHTLARLLAVGTQEAEASVITGYSLSRISVLKSDPQFQALVDHYQSTSADYVADMRKRMAELGLNALGELQERLEEEPEAFSPTMLRELVRDLADRTGHAPQRGPTSVTQINVGLSDRIAAARERVNRLSVPSGETITIPYESDE